MHPDSSFLHHSPCPKCGSRDNLGVYSDGHSYCFGCQYVIPPVQDLATMKRKISPIKEESNGNSGVSLSVHFVSDIPQKALAWLKKYGITESEILHYRICWNNKTSSLVFPIIKDEDLVIYRQERYFGPEMKVPKYLSYGKKDETVGVIYNRQFPESIILVEDFISAIKVARVCTAAPILGSNVPAKALFKLARVYKQGRVWLDYDKAANALREASRCLTAIPDVSVIITPLDPKEYSTIEILDFVKKSLRKPPPHRLVSVH